PGIRGCPKSNECYTKCGGFDKLNHRNANLLDSLLYINLISKLRTAGFEIVYSLLFEFYQKVGFV
ncbi:MAG: hypothetical protein IIX56_00875, partial [Treponema sp.]|nr:hypothetical protein [Treponema sp.]